MPSVENFYWILFETLLKPNNLDCWYYRPWGTTDHLSRGEFLLDHGDRTSREKHVLFHFDQEPIWNDNFGSAYDSCTLRWSKTFHMVANSEKSLLKKKILAQRHAQDWYFFYHGFAALDWFRDTRYVADLYDIQVPFLCLNHNVCHQRLYRLDLVSRLIQLAVPLDKCVSLHANQKDIEQAIQNDILSSASQHRIREHLVSRIDLPWQLDAVRPDGELSARIGYHEYKLWQIAFLHVVNETVFYERKLHLTEKIFKPIVASRPFVLVGGVGNLAYLRSYGFKTFDNWIDESYDDEADNDLRLDKLAREIARLVSLPISQLRKMHKDMQQVLIHNKRHLFHDFKNLIVNELVDNFEACFRIWNNGRVDDRHVKLPTNLAEAKKVLMHHF